MKKSKGIAVALVMCFVAVVATVGMTTLNRYERKTEVKEPVEEIQQSVKPPQQTVTPQQQAPVIQETTTNKVEAQLPEVQEAPETTVSQQFTFSKDDTLMWPVDGNVVLNYSMDQTIYFTTLDQYKYNPALIISGEEGKPVLAAASGRVKSIETNAQTGNTLTVDIGSGYEVIYGQLEEIRVVEGQKIDQGTVIGYLTTPTKYYTLEGCNLYFQVNKDGIPENPLEYMEE